MNWNALKKAVLAFVLTTTLSAGVFMASSKPAARNIPINTKKDKNRFIQVKLLGVNDFHGQLDTTRKFNGRNVGRVEYLSAYLNQKKKENKNTILVHAGDMVGGSPPISSFLQDEPTIEVLNKMGFDYGTLGNHEFDRGVNEMLRLIRGGNNQKTGYFTGANFPYICANVIDNHTGKTILPPYSIKNINGVPIGFIGVVIKDTPKIAPPNKTDGVKFIDEVKAINNSVKTLKKQGVKTIVVLAHNGGNQSKANGNATGEIVQMAKKMDDEVDIIISGHTHTYLNKEVDGKLIVQSYSYGTSFSDIQLTIDPNTKDIVDIKASIEMVYQDGIKSDPEIKKMIQNYESKIEPIVNKVVGKAANDILSKKNHNGESSLGNIIADSQRIAMKSDFAFMNFSGIRADLPKGDVTLDELFTIQPFKMKLVKMTLSGEQIRKLLNQQWQEHGSVRMLQISGLKYTWDSTKSSGQKVINIMRTDGTLINPQTSYTVTTNSYLANGGDNFSVLLTGKDKVEGLTDFDAFEEFMKEQKQPLVQTFDGRINRIK
ncbi:bifunctional metallophosphatase/5'-nucleotidase [Bacillus sp. AFS053548]|uniref:bifunctional metallophosphatase/5'-nucleotidase n=1 Tax=Bacillus sp. AFS053548 TaxID=2033505 RepID=UPI002570AF10|nr:bifunctional metallophosphatase/5'-nucleotidase [Bacillus sp. AFS053548]